MQKSKVIIGNEFEEEAYEILKEKFDEVEWLSRNHKSPFDFKCIKKNKILYGDAKVVNKNNKPLLSYSQKEADFIIAKIKGQIIFILKKDFDKDVNILRDGFTSITISNKTFKRLKILQSKFRFRSIREVIEKIFNEVDID